MKQIRGSWFDPLLFLRTVVTGCGFNKYLPVNSLQANLLLTSVSKVRRYISRCDYIFYYKKKGEVRRFHKKRNGRDRH
jgi:hypothetical protein